MMGKMKTIKFEIENLYPERAEELEKEFHKYTSGKLHRDELSFELAGILDSN